MHSSNHKLDRGAADSDAPMSTPTLPIELVEGILLHVPLRFPLASLGLDDAIHETCAAAFEAISLPNSYLAVFVPRFRNGAIKLCTNERFDMTLIHRLYLHGFNVADRPHFAAALLHNRVDYLNWWAFTAKLPAPASPESRDSWTDSLTQRAMEGKAWDSLEWLARTAFLTQVDPGLLDKHLSAMVKSGDPRQVQVVETWLACGISVWEYVIEVAAAASEVGSLDVLEAFRKGHREFVADRDDVDLCLRAAVEHGHLHVLDWMLNKAGWYLANVAEWACRFGRVEVLEWFKVNKHRIDPEDAWVQHVTYGPHGQPMRWPNEKHWLCLDAASEHGHVHILRWLLANTETVPLLYSDLALRQATMSGHVHVLDWWVKESGLELYYDPNTLFRNALLSEHYQVVLNWWIDKSGLNIDLARCTDVVSVCGACTVKVLERWNQTGRLFPCNVSDALCNAALEGNTHVLDWWKSSGIPLQLDHRLMDAFCNAASTGDIAVLDWWKSSGIPLQLDHRLMDAFCNAVSKGYIAVLDWWKSSGIPLQLDHRLMDALCNAVSKGHTTVLDWRKPSGIPLQLDHRLMDVASFSTSHNSVKVLEWVVQLCAEHSIPVQYSDAALNGIRWPFSPVFSWEHQSNNLLRLDVVKWWLKSGLPLKYTDEAFCNAVMALACQGQLQEATWWVRDSGLPVRHTPDAVRTVLNQRTTRVLAWMEVFGIDLS